MSLFLRIISMVLIGLSIGSLCVDAALEAPVNAWHVVMGLLGAWAGVISSRHED